MARLVALGRFHLIEVPNLIFLQVGECRVEETPWRPDSSGPLTEEQATEKARQIMRVTDHSRIFLHYFHCT